MLLLLLAASTLLAEKTEPPLTWVDPDTGHRVVRLTKEPGSASLYFNQNGYTADGKSLVYTTPTGISVLDLDSRQARQVVEGRVRLIDAGRKTPRVYYTKTAPPTSPIPLPAKLKKSPTCPNAAPSPPSTPTKR